MHLLQGALSQEELRSRDTVTTIDGTVLEISGGAGIQIGQLAVFGGEMKATNGYAHYVSGILRPITER